MTKEKRNIIVWFIIFLIVTLITNNAIINLLLYNQNFNVNNSDLILTGFGVNEKLLVGILFLYEFIFVVSGFVCYICFKIYNKIVRNEVAKIDDDKWKKIISNIFLSIVFIAFIVSDLIIYINANKYVEDALKQINIWTQNYFTGTDSSTLAKITANLLYYQQFPKLKVWSFIVLIFSLIPTVLLLKKVFSNQEKSKRKIISLLSNCLLITSIIIFVSASMYYYIDIPELKYNYSIYDNEVCVNGYSDNRDMLYEEKFIIPEKIANKNVTNVENYMLFNPDKKIVIPNTVKWENIWKTDQYGYESIYVFGTENNRIEMQGEPIEWFIEDKIAFNIERTEMVLLQENIEKMVVPETIEKIGIIEYITLFMENVEIEVSKENPYFLEWDNVIYERGKASLVNDDLTVEENDSLYGVMPKNKSTIKIMDNPASQITIFGTNENNKATQIILPNTMKNSFESLDVAITRGKSLESNYEIFVEEGNMFFTYENGILYDKEKTKIVHITPQVYKNNKVIISETIKTINSKIIKDWKDKGIVVEVDKNNPYLESTENGEIKYKVDTNIYNFEKEK